MSYQHSRELFLKSQREKLKKCTVVSFQRNTPFELTWGPFLPIPFGPRNSHTRVFPLTNHFIFHPCPEPLTDPVWVQPLLLRSGSTGAVVNTHFTWSQSTSVNPLEKQQQQQQEQQWSISRGRAGEALSNSCKLWYRLCPVTSCAPVQRYVEYSTG